MVDTLSTPTPTTSAPAAADSVRVSQMDDKVKSGNAVSRGIFSVAKQIGHNIDLVTFQGRVKDLYKLGDTIGVAISLGLRAFHRKFITDPVNPAKNFQEGMRKVAEAAPESKMAAMESALQGHSLDMLQAENAKDRKNASILVGNRWADGLNFFAQLGIALTSNAVEQEKLTRVYEKALKQEFGVDKVTKEHLKTSTNPIIRDSAEYYGRKAKYRMAPVFLGLIHAIPMVAKWFGEDKAPYKATKFLEEFSGSDASLGGMAAYYVWYFAKRQRGPFYQLDDLWDQTEGITSAENRSINRGVNPGTLVTSEKITKLYDEVSKEQNLPAFEVTDPLTNRIFDQISRYLNHEYMPLLYRVKKPDTKLHEELEGSHFTHADLVTLFGNKAIDINDAYATAVRLETLARKGIAEYRQVNEELAQVIRPEKNRYATNEQFATALDTYLGKLDAIAERTLGDAWPADYIKTEIRPEIPKNYGVVPTILPPEMRLAGPDRSAPVTDPAHSDGPTRAVPSYADAVVLDATNLRGKLDASMQERNGFRDRVAPQPNRAAETRAETHGERAEASHSGVMLGV